MGKKIKRRIQRSGKSKGSFSIGLIKSKTILAITSLWQTKYAFLIALAAIGIIIRGAFLNQPIKHDEAFTFLRFATLPFRELTGHYPLPNNHILHTILVKISTMIFGPWEWAIRLPVFLSGILLMPAMFVLGNKAMQRGSGYWAVALAAASFGLAAYSVNARGYMIVCLLTAIMFLVALNIRVKGGTIQDWSLFILCSILGLFTVPVMLFPLSSLSLWLLWDVNPALPGARTLILRRLAVAWVLITGGTALCYTPLIIDSGIDSLIANKYVQNLPLSVLITRLPELAGSLFAFFLHAIPWPMKALLSLGFILGLRRLPRLALSVAFCTLALILFQRAIPPERALSFGLIFFLLFSAQGMHSMSEWIAGRLRLAGRVPVSMTLALAWAVAGALLLLRLPHLGLQIENYPEARRVSSSISGYLDDKRACCTNGVKLNHDCTLGASVGC